jgi:hypothetical protein
MALGAYLDLRQLIPHGEAGTELRAIARDDERAARDERRIGNWLRAGLLAVFPAAIGIADGDLGAPVFLKLLERWPSADALAAAPREEVEALARTGRHGWPGRFAGRVQQAMAAPRLEPRPALARAKEGSIRLAASQLLAIRAQRAGEADGRAVARPAPLRQVQGPEGPRPGEGVPGRRDLPEHARPG